MLRAKFLYDDKMWIYCHVKYLRREFLDPKGKKVTTEISDLQDLWGHQVCLVHRYVNTRLVAIFVQLYQVTKKILCSFIVETYASHKISKEKIFFGTEIDLGFD